MCEASDSCDDAFRCLRPCVTAPPPTQGQSRSSCCRTSPGRPDACSTAAGATNMLELNFESKQAVGFQSGGEIYCSTEACWEAGRLCPADLLPHTEVGSHSKPRLTLQLYIYHGHAAAASRLCSSSEERRAETLEGNTGLVSS